jgi:hypothetical protein
MNFLDVTEGLIGFVREICVNVSLFFDQKFMNLSATDPATFVLFTVGTALLLSSSYGISETSSSSGSLRGGPYSRNESAMRRVAGIPS